MVRSMTGFGRFEETTEQRSIAVEIKSVNHKYFEYSSRISRGYAFLDDKLKNYLQNRISRGKVDVFVNITTLCDDDVQVLVNHSMAAGYYAALQELHETYHTPDAPSLNQLSRMPDIFSVHKQPEDEEEIWQAVLRVTEKAVDAFVEMRSAEGLRMKEDILSRADTIIGIVSKIEERSPQTVTEYRERLYAKLQEVLQDKNIDDQRILTEAAIFADKVAVAEETVRLRSHFDQLHTMMDSDQPVGRKLDFLVQEMNREINTIGSKASDAAIAYMVVDVKAEIEKIREQIQNIE